MATTKRLGKVRPFVSSRVSAAADARGAQEFAIIQENRPTGVHSLELVGESLLKWHVVLTPVRAIRGAASPWARPGRRPAPWRLHMPPHLPFFLHPR